MQSCYSQVTTLSRLIVLLDAIPPPLRSCLVTMLHAPLGKRLVDRSDDEIS